MRPSGKPSLLLLERNLLHLVSGSILPVCALLVPYNRLTPIVKVGDSQGVSSVLVWVAAAALTVALVCELFRFAYPPFNEWLLRRFGVFSKGRERFRVTGATYLLIGALGAFVLFDYRIAALALLYLSIADPVAAFVGARYGRFRIGVKSLEGSLAFLAASLAIAAIFTATGTVWPFWRVGIGALAATLVEALPLPIDDNITIPLSAGAVLAVLS